MDCALIDSSRSSPSSARSRGISKSKQQVPYTMNGNAMNVNKLNNINNNNSNMIVNSNSNGKRTNSELYESNENSNKRIKRMKIASLNENIKCRLCSGYLIDATTLVDCVHSFCRSCILKYIQNGGAECPTCKSQHRIKQATDLRMDKNLQNIVYSLVPRLYENEMARRRAFYSQHPDDAARVTPEQRGEGPPRPEDRISLVIEYMSTEESDQQQVDSDKSVTGENVASTSGSYAVSNGNKRRKCTESATNNLSDDNLNKNKLSKRYLLCTAGMPVVLLKKFIRKKYDLDGDQYDVEVAYKDTLLDDKWTLIDVSSYHSHVSKVLILFSAFYCLVYDVPYLSMAV